MGCVCLLVGLVSCTYTMRATIAAEDVRPETTSMLAIGDNIDVIEFDGAPVQWLGTDDKSRYNGVIIPSGRRTMIGKYKNSGAQYSQTFDFEPEGFYYIYVNNGMLIASNLTSRSDWAGEKAQMERAILNAQATQTIRDGGAQQN